MITKVIFKTFLFIIALIIAIVILSKTTVLKKENCIFIVGLAFIIYLVIDLITNHFSQNLESFAEASNFYELPNDPNWITVYSKGTYGAIDLGKDYTDNLFSRTGVFRRECSNCNPRYKDLYYKRITPVRQFSVYDNFHYWQSYQNNLNTDFKLYQSYADLLNDRNGWTFCNYDDPGIGFPRDCGGDGGQWNSLTRGGQPNVKYSLLSLGKFEQRPTPPCSAGWWQNGNECLQGCPLNSQTRHADGTCICDSGGSNQNCSPGLKCINKSCKKIIYDNLNFIPVFDRDFSKIDTPDGQFSININVKKGVMPFGVYGVTKDGGTARGGANRGVLLDNDLSTGIDFQKRVDMGATEQFPFKIIITIPKPQAFKGKFTIEGIYPWGRGPKDIAICSFSDEKGDNIIEKKDLVVPDKNPYRASTNIDFKREAKYYGIVVNSAYKQAEADANPSNFQAQSVWISNLKFEADKTTTEKKEYYQFYGDYTDNGWNGAPVDEIKINKDGELIFMRNDGGWRKMVKEDGTMKYTNLQINEIDPDKFDSYNAQTTPNAYKVRRLDSAPKLARTYWREGIEQAVKDCRYNNIPNSEFLIQNDIPYWKMELEIYSNYWPANYWQSLVGNMYNNQVQFGWGLWVNPNGILYWSTCCQTWNLDALQQLHPNGNSFLVTVTFENNKFRFTLKNINSGVVKEQTIDKTSALVTDKGFVTLGGCWANLGGEKFNGNISKIKVTTIKEKKPQKDEIIIPAIESPNASNVWTDNRWYGSWCNGNRSRNCNSNYRVAFKIGNEYSDGSAFIRNAVNLPYTDPNMHIDFADPSKLPDNAEAVLQFQSGDTNWEWHNSDCNPVSLANKPSRINFNCASSQSKGVAPKPSVKKISFDDSKDSTIILQEIQDIPDLMGWYDADSFTDSEWKDKSIRGNHIPSSNWSNIRKTDFYISGGTNSTFTNLYWPGANKDYTFIHLAKYNGGTRGRIWTGESGNWLSGFWNNGVGYFHEAWFAYNIGVSNGGQDWLLSVDQNNFCRANRGVWQQYGPSSSPTNVCINTCNYGNEKSDWAVAEFLIFKRKLKAEEYAKVELYLSQKYGLFTSIKNEGLSKKLKDADDLSAIFPALKDAFKIATGQSYRVGRVIYDANTMGWTAAAYHKAVDDKGPTLTVIELTDGRRVGAFLGETIDPKKPGFINTGKTFLIDKDEIYKIKPTNVDRAAKYDAGNFVLFGGNDIDIDIGGKNMKSRIGSYFSKNGKGVLGATQEGNLLRTYPIKNILVYSVVPIERSAGKWRNVANYRPQMRLNADGDVECSSPNGRDCEWFANQDDDCDYL